MIKNVFVLIFLGIFVLTGCFEEEKKVKKKRKPVERMASKVIKKVSSDKPLSQVVENDGIVVDGARDEKLLDAFGLAVSQVMITEGVSVPDCDSLAKTGFLTKEECEEITDKYSGFYEVTGDGEFIKVDNVFSEGIEGKGLKLGENIDFFDSSGNPLLDNEVEFNEYVADSQDVNLLKKLKAQIPKEKIEMLQNIEQKIEFLEDVAAQQQQQEQQQQKQEDVKQDDSNDVENEEEAEEEINYNDDGEDTAGDLKRLRQLEAQYSSILAKSNEYPDNQRYQDELLELQLEIDYLKNKLGL